MNSFTDLNCRHIAIGRSISLLDRTCSKRNFIKIAALRNLLEGALFTYNNRFGDNKLLESERQFSEFDHNKRKLILSNQSQNNTPNNIRSFLHAGIIGRGLKPTSKPISAPQLEVRDILLKAISVCCRQDVRKSEFIRYKSLDNNSYLHRRLTSCYNVYIFSE